MNYFIHESSYADAGCFIGEGTKIWHFSHLMRGSRIGLNSIVGQNVFIGEDVIVGDRVKIQNNVSLYSGVTLEDEVFVGPGCVFTNVINPRSTIERKHEFRPTIVCRGASLGANATILCGIKIGAYAMIGAGAVVTKDVADYALVTGNPARQTGWKSAFGRKLLFGDDNKAHCPESGQMYILMDGTVKRTVEL